MMLTDNKILVETAAQNYDKFKVPTSLIQAQKIKRYYTSEDLCDLDVKTSVNKIGEIVNLSQYLNSIYWQNIFNGQTVEENEELYQDICILAVMSGAEIDRAKKEYEMNSQVELNRLKAKYKIEDDGKHVKPKFFKMIAEENGFKPDGRQKFVYFKTPMDFLQKQLSSFNFRSNRAKNKEIVPFSDIIRMPETSIARRYYDQRNRILDLVYNVKRELNRIYAGYSTMSKEERSVARNEAAFVRQECVEYINNLLAAEPTMYLLLKALDDKEHRGISNLIFTTLFGTPNKLFFTMIIDKGGEIPYLEEVPDGEIDIMGFHFSRRICLPDK